MTMKCHDPAEDDDPASYWRAPHHRTWRIVAIASVAGIIAASLLLGCAALPLPSGKGGPAVMVEGRQANGRIDEVTAGENRVSRAMWKFIVSEHSARDCTDVGSLTRCRHAVIPGAFNVGEFSRGQLVRWWREEG